MLSHGHLKIILNLDSITRPLTGIGQLSLKLAEEFQNHPEVNSLFCYIGARLMACPNKYELFNLIPNSFEKDKVFLDLLRTKLKISPLLSKIYKEFKFYQFRRQVHEKKECVYLETGFLLKPFPGLRVPIIYDLSYLRYPEFHISSLTQKLNKELPDTLARADKILTLSDYIKNEIISCFNISEKTIDVVPPGIGLEFKPRSRLENLSILGKYKLPENYLLCVGTLEPRKNICNLVRSYSKLPINIRLAYPLVLVGMNGWLIESFEKELMPLVKKGEVIRLGYVIQEDLPYLYSGAHAFVYPSIYEGFGLPVLEAMASGIPILSSQKTAMAEFSMGAAILVDPLSESELTQGLKRLLLDKDIRASLVRVGLRLAKQFTWEVSIEKWISALKNIQ